MQNRKRKEYDGKIYDLVNQPKIEIEAKKIAKEKNLIYAKNVAREFVGVERKLFIQHIEELMPENPEFLILLFSEEELEDSLCRPKLLQAYQAQELDIFAILKKQRITGDQALNYTLKFVVYLNDIDNLDFLDHYPIDMKNAAHVHIIRRHFKALAKKKDGCLCMISRKQ